MKCVGISVIGNLGLNLVNQELRKVDEKEGEKEKEHN